jgi:DNA-binding transcriptional MerR regulator
MNPQNQQWVLPEREPSPAFRSGAVARMAQMPVATLRIWEQRYRAVRPTTAPSGHRLYSAADVQRVMLLRQLTEQGQAIGAMAGLDTAQLRELAEQHGNTVAFARAKAVGPVAALRLVVVGHALAARLQRPAVAQQLSKPAKLLAVFETLAEAARAASGSACDLLVWHVPALQASVPPELTVAQEAWQASKLAVVYRHAGAAAKAAFADAGASLVREPPDDEDLGAWLGSLQAASMPTSAASSEPLDDPALLAGSTVAPRRFDDAALTAIAGLPPTLACECPRHVAELLMQLSSFEAYSAGCIHRSPEDAKLHAYLQRVAGASRAMFEAALDSVAHHEGLNLG